MHKEVGFVQVASEFHSWLKLFSAVNWLKKTIFIAEIRCEQSELITYLKFYYLFIVWWEMKKYKCGVWIKNVVSTRVNSDAELEKVSDGIVAMRKYKPPLWTIALTTRR